MRVGNFLSPGDSSRAGSVSLDEGNVVAPERPTWREFGVKVGLYAALGMLLLCFLTLTFKPSALVPEADASGATPSTRFADVHLEP